MIEKQDPIAHAARLLREAAEELRQAHTLSSDRNNWIGEPEAKAAYDEHLAAAHALRMEQEATKAAPGKQFDSEGFRAWVRKNLPDDTIIGNSEWWADHLTTWAQRFVKAAPQQEVQEPAFVDVSLRTAIAKAVYQQVRVEFDYKLGSWTALDADEQQRIVDSIRGLYTAPQPAPAPLSDDAKDAARYRWLRENWFTMTSNYQRCITFKVGEPRWSDITEEELDAAIDAALAAQQ